MKKTELLARGMALSDAFCKLNDLQAPPVTVRKSSEWPYGACAFYRPTRIEICLEKCAAIGVAGPAWSYPGYCVDRTPYGVLQHELGHHVDVVKGGAMRGYQSHFSQDMRKATGEAKLTNYCPNDGEWFAEMFRLFVTNPELLKELRPKTYTAIAGHFKPVVVASWDMVLQDAPERTKAAAVRRMLAV